MAQIQGNSSAAGGRIDGTLQRTALAATDFALGVGWGDGAVTKTLLTGSTDQRGQLTVTSVGSNQAQATATVVLTFADGAWAAAPFCIPHVTSNSAIDEGHLTWTSTTTALTLTFSVLPVATKIYKISYLCIA
jgi:hypothetical protein